MRDYKISGLLRSLLAPLVFMLSMFVVSMIVSAVAGLLGMENKPLVLALSSVASAGVTLLYLSFIGMVRWRETFSTCGLLPARSVCVVLFSMLLITGLNIFSEMLELPDSAASSIEALAHHPLGVLSLVLVGPLAEELVFREAMIGCMLRNAVSPRKAILFSALLFGLIHANPAQIPFAFVTGLLLGYLYCQTKSIVLTFAIHILNNGLAVLLLLLFGEDATLSEMLCDPSTCIFLATVLCFVGAVGIKYADRIKA